MRTVRLTTGLVQLFRFRFCFGRFSRHGLQRQRLRGCDDPPGGWNGVKGAGGAGGGGELGGAVGAGAAIGGELGVGAVGVSGSVKRCTFVRPRPRGVRNGATMPAMTPHGTVSGGELGVGVGVGSSSSGTGTFPRSGPGTVGVSSTGTVGCRGSTRGTLTFGSSTGPGGSSGISGGGARSTGLRAGRFSGPIVDGYRRPPMSPRRRESTPTAGGIAGGGRSALGRRAGSRKISG